MAETGGGAATLLVAPGRFEDDELRVEGEAYRHLFRARRLAVGDPVRVVDGRGRARLGRVERVDRTAAVLALGAPCAAAEPERRLELLVAVFRPERAAWLVEKATEVGVAAVRFLHTERAPRTFGAGTMERLRRVAGAAVEQCGRALVPEVTGVHGWGELATLVEGIEQRLVLDTAAAGCDADKGPGKEEASKRVMPPEAISSLRSCVVLVGPEGGWADSERAAARALRFEPLNLGPRTLRVETAALVAAARLLL